MVLGAKKLVWLQGFGLKHINKLVQQRNFDEGRGILIFVERIHLSIKFNTKSNVFFTKSNVFLNTAHLMHIAVSSFYLALYKGRGSSFIGILWNTCEQQLLKIVK